MVEEEDIYFNTIHNNTTTANTTNTQASTLSTVFGTLQSDDEEAVHNVVPAVVIKHVPLTIVTAVDDDNDNDTDDIAASNAKSKKNDKVTKDKDIKKAGAGAKAGAGGNNNNTLVANNNWSYFPIPHYGQQTQLDTHTQEFELDEHTAPPSVLEMYYEPFLRQWLSAHRQVHPYSLTLTAEQRIVFALFQLCGRPDGPIASSIR